MLAVTGNRLTKGTGTPIGVARYKPLLITRWGQSNQVGVAPIAQLPYSNWNTEIKGFKAVNNYPTWDNTIFGSSSSFDNRFYFGADWSFSYKLQPYINKRIYINKHALGSTSVYDNWKPGATLYDTAWTRLGQVVNDMNTILGAGNWDHVFMWNQGENDAMDATKSSAYYTGLKLLFDNVVNTYAPKYAVITKTAPELPSGYPYITTVRAAQDAVIASFNNPKYITVDTNGIHDSTQLHFDANGYEEVGLREFNALKAIL